MTEAAGVTMGFNDLQTLALTNYGHFTSMRVDDMRVQGLSYHLERLTRDCRALFGVDLDPDAIRASVRQELGNTLGSFGVRVTVFDPTLDMGHPSQATHPRALVTVRLAADLPLPALSIQSRRYARENPTVKHVGLYGTLSLRRAAQLDGFDDVVFVGDDSLLSEGATWNIGFFDGENVVWPEAECLDGVTMRILKAVHPRTIVAPVSLDDVPQMQAAFATNAAIGVRPIRLINSTPFPADHPIIETLHREYINTPGDLL